MGKKTRRIKSDKSGNSYVYSYSHRYDKKEKKTKQGTSRYLGKFDGTYDKDGNPNYIPSRSSQPIELKRFWDIFQQSVETDELIKNRKILNFVIQEVIANPDFKFTDLFKLLDRVEKKTFIRTSLINPVLEKTYLTRPLLYSSWDDSLKGFKNLIMNRKTEEILQFISPSKEFEMEKKMKYGHIPVISGDTEKLIENRKYDSSSEFVIIGREYIEEKLFPLWFEAHDYYVYSHEIFRPDKQELMVFLRRIDFLEQITPAIWSLVFGDAIDSLLDPADYHGLIDVFSIKLYEIFSSTDILDIPLIKGILQNNPTFVKIKDSWMLLDQRIKLSVNS